MKISRTVFSLSILAFVAGCGGGDSAKITADSAKTFEEIGEQDVLNFAGNEPFWGGKVSGTILTYSTPENIDGTAIKVKRFAGLNGLGFSGMLGDAKFDMAVTPGECDDTMADRTYPYVVTLIVGDETRTGCGWTKANPYAGTENP